MLLLKESRRGNTRAVFLSLRMLRSRRLRRVRRGVGIGLFGSGKIGPWRETLIDRLGRGRYNRTRDGSTRGAAERSIEIVLTDITGLFVAGYRDSAQI
jgi:hypothetical protein